MTVFQIHLSSSMVSMLAVTIIYFKKNLQVNAAYFKGNWQSAFLPTSTKKDVFYPSFNKQAETDMMAQHDTFNYRM